MKATCLRIGGYGDLMFASSVLYGLKQQGYHTTLVCAMPSKVIIENDPNIDAIILHDKSMPESELMPYFKRLAQQTDKFVNLSGSIEAEILQMPGQTTYEYPYEVRKKLYDRNYLEHSHLLAQIPFIPHIKFYPTTDEINRSNEFRKKLGKKIIVWVLGGSARHKINPNINTFIANIQKLNDITDIDILLVGQVEQNPFADGVKNAQRVHLITDMPVRDQYTLVQQHADIILGPETGIMVAMSQESMRKIVFLSHSTPNMLTRDWVNTLSLEGKGTTCNNCCKFRMVTDEDVWGYQDDLTKNPDENSYSQCQALMPMQSAFEDVIREFQINTR
jgi:ADP-heptose:LPS heptosyltransferase